MHDILNKDDVFLDSEDPSVRQFNALIEGLRDIALCTILVLGCCRWRQSIESDIKLGELISFSNGKGARNTRKGIYRNSYACCAILLDGDGQ
jgi:hypothetical protein